MQLASKCTVPHNQSNSIVCDSPSVCDNQNFGEIPRAMDLKICTHMYYPYACEYWKWFMLTCSGHYSQFIELNCVNTRLAVLAIFLNILKSFLLMLIVMSEILKLVGKYLMGAQIGWSWLLRLYIIFGHFAFCHNKC